ncbi:AAA family ATPase, partial [Sphingomonas sp. AR_OL41]|uniref:AAA family ATPase n=1 Tax=Sphingomonas sp. AR_OL41 TaxID=3042729 RepID=UPI0024814C44
DEAGMIGSRQMERVVSEAEARGAKVVLVGDASQLQAIEAGAAFRATAERHGSVEITEIRRQREDWQRDATRQLATGRTGEALGAYHDAGMLTESATRESAREALIERWDSARIADPGAAQMILTHTRAECDELNGLARERLKSHGLLASDITVKTTHGERLFAVEDRIMFLRNERELGVKNGSLGTIEQLDRASMAVRLDDGRQVTFDHKDYADLTHGYAATIHKSQGVTVDRTHVLATPGLDRHGAYVAMSRHRDGVELHYGRDDFADRAKLERALSRDRPKDMALDYDGATTRFAKRRGYDRSPILDTLARERLVEPSHEAPAPAQPRRGMFDGIRFDVPVAEPRLQRGMFDGLQLPSAPAVPPVERREYANIEALAPAGKDKALGGAVQRYARTIEDMQRMTGQNLPVLEQQKVARESAAVRLDQVQAGATRDLDTAFARAPALVSEAANGRTANALRALQLESEVRNNPELRADRFVQAWRQLGARRDKLSGWQNEDARAGIEKRMTAMAKGLERDHALGAALSKRGSELFGKKWSPEWSAGSPDGGMVRELTSQRRTAAVIQQLTESLGRGRNLGIGL